MATSAPISAASLTWFDGADRGSEDFGLEVVIVVDLADFADQVHAVDADVVEPADEGRDEGRAGLGGEQRLDGREAERDIDLVPSEVSALQALRPSKSAAA